MNYFLYLFSKIFGSKIANCQVTSNGQKMIKKNIKYLNEIRKEIEKLNTR